VRQEDQAREAEVEGEVVSRREAPRLMTMCGSRTGGWSLPCVMSD
jgi:hypothetical protein